jgi:hypothetical protein
MSARHNKDFNTLQNLKHKEFIELLEKKIEQSISSEHLFPQSTFLKFSEQPTPDKKNYARQLIQQIEEKHKKKLEDIMEKNKPAISESFHGYPNRPQTPQTIRREREKIRMQSVKEALEQQIFAKKSQKNSIRVKEIESEKIQNIQILKKIEEENMQKLNKKTYEKEILTESWEKAKKSRNLRDKLELIETNGLSLRSKSLLSKKESLVSKQESSRDIIHVSPEIAESLDPAFDSVDYLEPIDEKTDNSFNNSIAPKSNKPEVYRSKISQVLKQAKSNRNAISKSLSPTKFQNKKLIQKPRNQIRFQTQN